MFVFIDFINNYTSIEIEIVLQYLIVIFVNIFIIKLFIVYNQLENRVITYSLNISLRSSVRSTIFNENIGYGINQDNLSIYIYTFLCMKYAWVSKKKNKRKISTAMCF